jgi:hypothetical protein
VRLFDLPQAKHFCAHPQLPRQGSEQSLARFHLGLGKLNRLQEGTPEFDIHRINLLISAERWLLYSIGHYRRALEMLVPASLPWGQVTLYYASFFSANSLLAMFGSWVGQTITGVITVDVEKGSPGQQELRIFRGAKAKSPNGARGSHRIFWDFFYDSIPSISAWVPQRLAGALNPVNGDYTWQITSRNDVNYDMFHAWQASKQFHGTFRKAKLNSLSGPMRLQLEATEHLIRLALYFARELSLSGSALVGCGITGDRANIQKGLLKQKSPALINQSAFPEFVA